MTAEECCAENYFRKARNGSDYLSRLDPSRSFSSERCGCES